MFTNTESNQQNALVADQVTSEILDDIHKLNNESFPTYGEFMVYNTLLSVMDRDWETIHC